LKPLTIHAAAQAEVETAVAYYEGQREGLGIEFQLSEDELIERDSRRDLGKELLEAVDQMKRGQIGYVHRVALPPIASARIKAGLSASQFAELLGISVRTLMDWERGRREPSGAAKTTITIALKHPELLHELIDKQAS
jgi:putative transcriptional regulator